MEKAKYELNVEWLGARLRDYAAAKERAHKAWVTRKEAVMAKMNAGVKPTVGSNRKGEFTGFHAPHDGYVHEWVEGEKTFRKQFMGGQFLPIDKNQDSMFENELGEMKTHRFRNVSGEKFDAVERALLNSRGIYALDIRIGRGKSWEDREGNWHSYTYLTDAPNDVAEHIEMFFMGEIYEARQVAEEKRQAEHEAAEPCPTGRVVVTGEVLSVKLQDGYYGSTWKMLVKDDRGFKVWGSIPSSLDASRGCRVTFTAAIEPSNDDDKFGFYKRPTKAEILEEAA